MSKSKLPQEVAAERFEIISPLLDPNLDADLFCAKKNELAEHCSLSYRTIGRWYKRYKQEGFQGLIPKSPVPKQPLSKLPDNFPEVVEQAIALRRECPTRSVKTIIRILELEGLIQAGAVCRSTLQRHLQRRGFGTKQFRKYQHAAPAARRFQKSYRGALYQGDSSTAPIFRSGRKARCSRRTLPPR